MTSQATPVWFITGCSTGFGRQLRLVMTGKAHPFGAATFEELEVIGVVNHATGIGIFVVNTHGNGECVWIRLEFHRGILPCNATMFCNGMFPRSFSRLAENLSFPADGGASWPMRNHSCHHA